LSITKVPHLLDSVIRIDVLRELHTGEAVRAMAREAAPLT